MARRKQTKPTRPKRGSEEVAGEQYSPAAKRLKSISSETEFPAEKIILLPEIWAQDGKEIAEINLLAATFPSASPGRTWSEKDAQFNNAALRTRVRMPNDTKVKSGIHIPELSGQDLRIQVVMYRQTTIPDDVCSTPTRDGVTSRTCEDLEDTNDIESPDDFEILASGQIDGSDSAISALAYLICQGYVTLRPALSQHPASTANWGMEQSCCLRVIICPKTFTGLDGYLKKHLWKKTWGIVIPWLRPELVCETRHSGGNSRCDEELTENFEQWSDRTGCAEQRVFDPSQLYRALQRSCTEPALDICFPELLPHLRPYQCRAAYWMVQRERRSCLERFSQSDTSIPRECDPNTSSTSKANPTMSLYSIDHPLWVSVLPTDGSSEFFFNPFSGAISLLPEDPVSYVYGGILADEMGLGKTVELLACILANPCKEMAESSAAEAAMKVLHNELAIRKRTRVECACGAVEEDERYVESWVQCDVCDAWQHATCVGYGPPALLNRRDNLTGHRNVSYHRNRKLPINSRNEIVQRAQGDLERLKSRKLKKGVEEDSYVCGACAKTIGSVQVKGVCKATLVVCPSPILQQWQDEIRRHTRAGSLRVIVYEGVGKGAFILMPGKDVPAKDSKRLKIVSAHELAAADIVLTTYDTLKADLSHDSDKSKSESRSMRYVKRYPVIPTPLTRLRWWRVCLDEAQMVESSTARATEMALLLDAQNRWCVTGTPIQRGLDDLYGLLRFLQAAPFNDYQNWSQSLRKPYEAGSPDAISYMHKFLGSLMWRSSKAEVKDELSLPPQEEYMSWLRFSAVESHFYRQQHEKCAAKAREVIAKYCRQQRQPCGLVDTGESCGVPASNAAHCESLGDQMKCVPDVSQRDGKLPENNELVPESNGRTLEEAGSGSADNLMSIVGISSTSDFNRMSGFSFSDADRPLSKSEASLLSTSLLRLRQACCHPQVGSAGIRSLQQRSPMTMDEILQVLVDKAKIEAEEALRVLIGALNGLGAIAAIDGDLPLSISIYREVLSLAEENAADVDVDPLQKLHTLHNLAEILGISSLVIQSQESSSGIEIPSKSQQDTNVVPASSSRKSLMSEGFISMPSLHCETPSNSAERQKIYRNAGVLSPVGGVDQVDSINERGSNIPRTLRDDVLINECHEIKSKYMATFQAKLANALLDFESSHSQVTEARIECERGYGGTEWWLAVVDARGEDLVIKIRSHLLESDNLGKNGRHRNASSLALRFQEASGLKYVVDTELRALGQARNQVVERLKNVNKIMQNPTTEDTEKIANCPRDSERTNGSLCVHCEMDDLFQMYENRLHLLRTSAAEAGGVVSAEDAVIAQHRILAHKRISGTKDVLLTTGSKLAAGPNDVQLRARRGSTGAGATETEVLRAPSEIEQILSIIKAHCRQAAGERNAATKHLHVFENAATKHLHVFEVMKKEYSHMRALTKIQREALYALDELNMATTRLTLQLPGEEIENDVERFVKLHAEEVPQRNVQLTVEKFDALKEFSRSKGQLRYLKGLSSARKRRTNPSRLVSHPDKGKSTVQPNQELEAQREGWHNDDEDTCPVCHDKLGSQLMVLPCGHLLCCKCCMVIIERQHNPTAGVSQKRITCPNCRLRTYVGDIAYVDNGRDGNVIAEQMGQLAKGAQADEEAAMQVTGSYGTKIEAVVRRLLWVASKDPDAKVLVFSTWSDVLDVLEHALAANLITFARVKGSKLNQPIQKFRGISSHLSSPDCGQASIPGDQVRVLLLPTERGANGLNLIEAQHVILIEPLPNPAIEAQAVNRVHRIGQTRATFVHRFIVSDTVEETIYWLGKQKTDLSTRLPGAGVGLKKDHHSLTLSDVNALFTSKSGANGSSSTNATSSAAHQSDAWRSLTPVAAAAAAAEARLISNMAGISNT